MRLVFFVIFFIYSLSAWGRPWGLYYQCVPNHITEEPLYFPIDNRVLSHAEIEASEMVFHLVYPDGEKDVIEWQGREKLYKMMLLLFGEYKSMVWNKYKVPRTVEMTLMQHVTDKEFHEVVVNRNVCRSFFCSVGIALDYSVDQMHRARQLGYHHYYGGLHENERQLDATDFSDRLIYGLQAGEPNIIAKVFKEPTTVIMLEVPDLFAQKKQRPPQFDMRAVLIDEIFGIFDPVGQELYRQEIQFSCVRNQDMSSGDLLDLFVHSKTTHDLVEETADTAGITPEGERPTLQLTIDDGQSGERDFSNMKEYIAPTAIGAGVLASIWKLRKLANPLTAFMAGLGVQSVASSDLCSDFTSESGRTHFKNMDFQTQYQWMLACPDLLKY